jgi:hypothetical protein
MADIKVNVTISDLEMLQNSGDNLKHLIDVKIAAAKAEIGKQCQLKSNVKVAKDRSSPGIA